VEARGKTPAGLAHEIEDRLQRYINQPHITIGVVETKPLDVSVLGECAHPGMFTLAPGAGVLQALASAGGFTEFANQNRIYVVRRNPPMKVRFSYDDLTANQGNSARFVLRSGDVVTVE
jgi:polysaccharide export outer membrane protein